MTFKKTIELSAKDPQDFQVQIDVHPSNKSVSVTVVIDTVQGQSMQSTQPLAQALEPEDMADFLMLLGKVREAALAVASFEDDSK